VLKRFQYGLHGATKLRTRCGGHVVVWRENAERHSCTEKVRHAGRVIYALCGQTKRGIHALLNADAQGV
jgi:hypothetical protein